MAAAALSAAACSTTIAGTALGADPVRASAALPSITTVPPPVPEAEPADPTREQTSAGAASVVEGDYCAPRDATAVFADGTTAYCARLQYSGATVWSRNPDLAPNPAMDSLFDVRPDIGLACESDNVGGAATDPAGRHIVCNGAVWVPIDSAPQMGEPCASTNIGRTENTASGAPIICDGHEWAFDHERSTAQP